MKNKVVVLIDGQNMHYDFEGLKIREIDVNWGKLLLSLISDGDELARTYWFRPARLLDGHLSDSNIKKKIAYKSFSHHAEMYAKDRHDEIPQNILTAIDSQSSNPIRWLKAEKERFNRIEHNYDKISLLYDDIEIVKCGVVKIDPFKQIYLGEKGVDISLAVKMISLSVEKKCDKIILISGDYDYLEAVQFVKNNMTKVHVVKIHKGYPPRNKSMSKGLSICADRVVDLYEEDIRKKFIITDSSTSIENV